MEPELSIDLKFIDREVAIICRDFLDNSRHEISL